MTKNTKVVIIIIVSLTIFLLVFFLLNNKDGVVFQSNKSEGYLIVGQNAMFSYHNKKMYNVPLKSDVRKELDWADFNVLVDYKKEGNYLMHYDEKWYLFTKDKKAINYESDNLIAYKSNYNMDYVYKETTDIVDDKYASKVADDKGVLLKDLTVSNEVHMDIDKDGKNETFYLISTALPIIPTENKEYSIVFMVKDGKIYNIFDNLGEQIVPNICQPKIEGFINFNENKNYEVILSCSTMGPHEQRVYLYEMTKSNGPLHFELKASNT